MATPDVSGDRHLGRGETVARLIRRICPEHREILICGESDKVVGGGNERVKERRSCHLEALHTFVVNLLLRLGCFIGRI